MLKKGKVGINRARTARSSAGSLRRKDKGSDDGTVEDSGTSDISKIKGANGESQDTKRADPSPQGREGKRWEKSHSKFTGTKFREFQKPRHLTAKESPWREEVTEGECSHLAWTTQKTTGHKGRNN